MDLKRIADTYDAKRLAERLIDQRAVWDLQEYGSIKIPVTQQVDRSAFKEAAIEVIEDLWNDEKTNYFVPIPSLTSYFIDNQFVVKVRI